MNIIIMSKTKVSSGVSLIKEIKNRVQDDASREMSASLVIKYTANPVRINIRTEKGIKAAKKPARII